MEAGAVSSAGGDLQWPPVQTVELKSLRTKHYLIFLLLLTIRWAAITNRTGSCLRSRPEKHRLVTELSQISNGSVIFQS